MLLGMLAFMAAFELGGKGNNNATRTGTLQFVKDLPAGDVLLLTIAGGLFCYVIWRVVEAFHANGDKKGWAKRLRYLFSALTYLAFALTAIRISGGGKSGGSNQNQSIASELLSKPL